MESSKPIGSPNRYYFACHSWIHFRDVRERTTSQDAQRVPGCGALALVWIHGEMVYLATISENSNRPLERPNIWKDFFQKWVVDVVDVVEGMFQRYVGVFVETKIWYKNQRNPCRSTYKRSTGPIIKWSDLDFLGFTCKYIYIHHPESPKTNLGPLVVGTPLHGSSSRLFFVWSWTSRVIVNIPILWIVWGPTVLARHWHWVMESQPDQHHTINESSTMTVANPWKNRVPWDFFVRFSEVVVEILWVKIS